MSVNQLTRANPDGTSFGQSTSDLISCYGATPIAQRSGASQATVTTTAVAPVSTTAVAPVATTAISAVSTTAVAPVSTTAVAAVATTAATSTSPWGYSEAQANAIFAAINYLVTQSGANMEAVNATITRQALTYGAANSLITQSDANMTAVNAAIVRQALTYAGVNSLITRNELIRVLACELRAALVPTSGVGIIAGA